MNNPTSLIDPLGLQCQTPDGQDVPCPDVTSVTVTAPPPLPLPTQIQSASIPGLLSGQYGHPSGSTGRPGSGPKPKPTTLDISKTWQRTFAYSDNATQLMASVQSNFSQFANNFMSPLTAEFSEGPIEKGGVVDIYPGVFTELGPIEVKDLRVTVSAQGPNGWVFTADPTQHFFNGTVAFSAANAPNGEVNFMVTVNANFTNKFTQYALGDIIRAGENSTWNNLLTNVQNYCGQTGVQ